MDRPAVVQTESTYMHTPHHHQRHLPPRKMPSRTWAALITSGSMLDWNNTRALSQQSHALHIVLVAVQNLLDCGKDSTACAARVLATSFPIHDAISLVQAMQLNHVAEPATQWSSIHSKDDYRQQTMGCLT